jgi:hypothetical protein
LRPRPSVPLIASESADYKLGYLNGSTEAFDAVLARDAEASDDSRKTAYTNVQRAFVHLSDNQLCGIWPDGSSLRGNHIKHMFDELFKTAVASLRNKTTERKEEKIDPLGPT